MCNYNQNNNGRQGGYNNNNRQGGYNNNRQGGYNNNRQGGYNNNNHQGGYNNNRQGGHENNNRNNGNYDEPQLNDITAYKDTLENKGYYLDDSKETLCADFIISYARTLAENLDISGKNTMNKRTQVRKFYEYLLRLDRQYRRSGRDFSCFGADLAEVVPKAAYAFSRKVVSQEFKEFIEINYAAVADYKDFEAFLKHFEAIIAYMKKDTK